MRERNCLTPSSDKKTMKNETHLIQLHNNYTKKFPLFLVYRFSYFRQTLISLENLVHTKRNRLREERPSKQGYLSVDKI